MDPRQFFGSEGVTALIRDALRCSNAVLLSWLQAPELRET